jgi:hypothetical protein
MNKITRTVLTLVSSFLLFGVGIYRIFTESLSSTPLFVAYIFVITGFIGMIANAIVLKKLHSISG